MLSPRTTTEAPMPDNPIHTALSAAALTLFCAGFPMLLMFVRGM